VFEIYCANLTESAICKRGDCGEGFADVVGVWRHFEVVGCWLWGLLNFWASILVVMVENEPRCPDRN
jgi:hypothetical protein